jgi:hypothetical protein
MRSLGELWWRRCGAKEATYASPPWLPTPSQGSLPTCGTALWLDGLRTRWTEFLNFRSFPSNSFLSDQPFLVATANYSSGSLMFPWRRYAAAELDR